MKVESTMKLDGPPVHGTSGRTVSWLIGIILTVVLTLCFAAGAAVISHGQRITVLESQMSDIKQTLSNIDGKLDRLLRR